MEGLRAFAIRWMLLKFWVVFGQLQMDLKLKFKLELSNDSIQKSKLSHKLIDLKMECSHVIIVK